MKPGFKQISNTLFIILIWSYFATIGKYILIYQESHSLFLFDLQYIKGFLNFPGGLTEYLAAFLVQFNYYPVLGALIVAFIFGAIAILTQRFLASLPYNVFFLSYLPPIIFLFFVNKPEFGIALPLAFSFNLLSVFIYTKIKKANFRYVFAFITLLLMYFATAGLFHLFWMTVVLIDVLYANTNHKKIFIPTFLAVAFLLPVFASLKIYHINFSTSYFRLLGDSFSQMPTLFFVLIGFYFVVPVLSFFYRKKTTELFVMRNGTVSKATGITVCLLITAATLYYGYDKKVSQMICTANAARSNNWDQVLQISSEYESSNYLMSYYTNLALYNKGEMNKNLLDYNQSLGTKGLFFTWDRSRKKSEHGGQLYFDLGFINEAHHWAFESLISNGENAEQFKMLALTNLINGKRKSAAKYLRKLDKSLFYSKWAKSYLPLANDAFIQQKRKQMPNADFFMNLNNLAPDLVQLLESNAENEAAYDYLQSYYLLSNQVNLFAKTLKEFKAGNKISPLYQQALLIYLSAHPNETGDYQDFLIEEECKKLFGSYAQAMRAQQPRRGNIPAKFEEEFKNTYWYYLHFISPHGNKVITN